MCRGYRTSVGPFHWDVKRGCFGHSCDQQERDNHWAGPSAGCSVLKLTVSDQLAGQVARIPGCEGGKTQSPLPIMPEARHHSQAARRARGEGMQHYRKRRAHLCLV